MAIAGPTGIIPVPVAVTHDPLGRAMTEEQKQRLREQIDPPVEETSAKERLRERRRDGASRNPPEELPAEASHAAGDGGTATPGSIVDSYA
jgi:hypothetical protein